MDLAKIENNNKIHKNDTNILSKYKVNMSTWTRSSQKQFKLLFITVSKIYLVNWLRILQINLKTTFIKKLDFFLILVFTALSTIAEIYTFFCDFFLAGASSKYFRFIANKMLFYVDFFKIYFLLVSLIRIIFFAGNFMFKKH